MTTNNVELEKELGVIGEQLRTQDNRITSHPMFVVERRVRDYGYDLWEKPVKPIPLGLGYKGFLLS